MEQNHDYREPSRAGDGQIDYPSAVFLYEGDMMVADGENNRISEFTPEGQFLSHLIVQSDGINLPFDFTFTQPYIWIVNDEVGKLYKIKIYED